MYVCVVYLPYFSVVPTPPLLPSLPTHLAVNRVRQSPHPLTKLMAGSVTNDHQSHCVGRGRGRVCDCVCVCVSVSVVAIARLMFQVSRHALECPLKPGTPRPRESKGGGWSIDAYRRRLSMTFARRGLTIE